MGKYPCERLRGDGTPNTKTLSVKSASSCNPWLKKHEHALRHPMSAHHPTSIRGLPPHPPPPLQLPKALLRHAKTKVPLLHPQE